MNRVDGAFGAIFIDREGEAIAQYATLPKDEIKLMGAYFGIIWLALKRLTERSIGFPATEVMITLDNGICLMTPLQKEYLIILTLKPAGNIGQARRWMKWASEEIQKEI